MATEIFEPSLDYSLKVLNASTPIYRKIQPQSAGSVQLSQTSASSLTEFVIPSSCMNLSKSRLNFTLSVPQQAAGTAINVNANLLTALSRVVLYDVATNAQWLDCSNFEKYASMVSVAGTSLSEFLTKSYSTTTPAITLAGATAATVEDIAKSNSTDNDTLGIDPTTTGTVQAVALGAQNAYMGRRQWYLSAAVDTPLVLDVSIPLSAFKFTALSLDRVIYTPSNLVLQCYWNSTDNYISTSTTAGEPHTGSASLTVSNGLTLSNIQLSLCNEGNLSICQQLIESVVKEGISMPIGYPTVLRQALSGSTIQSYTQQLTRGLGARILAIITAPFANNANIATRNVHQRGALTTYNTYVNSVALLNPGGFDCLRSEDYILANREALEKSAIQTLGEYVNAEWIHVDQFTSSKGLYDMDMTLVSGLDCSNQSATWQLTATQSQAQPLTWCNAIIGQKVLSISNQGSTVI